MMRSTQSRSVGAALAVWAVALTVGCSGPSDDPSGPNRIQLAKSGAGPTVSQAAPSYGHQGDVSEQVTITGSGFASGASAAWERNGTVDPNIQVTSTQYVSSTQLVATITIQANATISYYDIGVTNPDRKKGIGYALFAVTQAVVIDPDAGTSAVAVNDAGRVLGLNKVGGVYVFDVSTRASQVIDATGTGTPWDIDQLGTTASGQSNGLPALWRTTGGAWSVQILPDLGAGGAARAIASDGSGAPVFLIGNVFRTINGTGHIKTPARWYKDGTGAWALDTLPRPNGINFFGQDVTPTGMAVGMDGVTCCLAIFWDVPGATADTGTVLPPLVPGAASAAYAINDAGTIIVGHSNGVAVAWKRVSTADSWTTPVALENTSSYCKTSRGGGSGASDVNAAGIIVGSSCGHAVVWKPSGAGYTRLVLGDVGNHPNNAEAIAINNAAIPVAVGTAGPAVYWINF